MIPSGYFDRLSKVESGDNPSAKNPTSSAKGRYQFINSTAEQYGITAEFGTPEYEQQETQAVQRFTQDNYNQLRTALKRDPMPGELYLAHQQGAAGAAKILSSPNARAVDVLGKEAVINNGGSEDMTASDFAKKWTSKFEAGMADEGGATGPVNKTSYTEEQLLQELQRRKAVGVNNEVPKSTPSIQYTEEQLLQELQRRKKEIGTPTYIQRIYKMAKDREDNYQKTLSMAQEAGNEGFAFIPQIGEAAGIIGDVGFETVATVARNVAPEVTQEIAAATGATVRAVMNTPPAKFLSNEYREFKQKHPLLAENIEGTLSVASFLIPAASGRTAVAKASTEVADLTKTATKEVVKKSDDLLKVAATVKPRIKEARQAVQIKQTDRAIKRILDSSNKSYADMLDELRNTDVLTIADIAGDEVQGLTRSLGKTEGAKDLIHSTLRQRGESAISRVSTVLSQKISNVDNYFGNIDELGKARSLASRPLYKRAMEEGADIVDDRLTKFLADKRIIDAMNDAKLRYGVRAEAASNSLETLDGVKKVLYDIESAAKRKGETNLAGAYGDLRRDLVSVLDENVPSYAAARKVFEHPSKLIDAQEAGRGFLKLQPEELKKFLADLEPHELEAYRIGVRQKLQEVVSTTTDNADPAKRIFGNEMKRKQLEVVFETKEHYDEFAKRMRDEIKGFETRNTILGGSRSDYNIASDIGFIDAAADASRLGVLTAVTDRVVMGIYDSLKKMYVGISDGNAKKIAEILVDREKGIKALEELLAKQDDMAQRAAVSQVIKNHGAMTMIDND
jgi:hypothetical protein